MDLTTILSPIAPLVLLMPFLMFLFLGLLGYKMSGKVAGIFGTAGFTVVAAICYYIAGKYFLGGGYDAASGSFQQFTLFNMDWLQMSTAHPGLFIRIGFLLDPISAMMLVVISTVSLMVHLYSFGYMFEDGKYDEGMQRYYCVLSLFSFAMLGLVIATNIFQMYIFWELVGVSSFLLIGYYYKRPAAVSACKKAFIVTRFADMFFLIGILIVSYYTKAFDFDSLIGKGANVGNGLIHTKMAGLTFMGCSVTSIAMLFIFLGGAGKSAMFPFHIWLPDAMEGPTPSSALIHAATMVVAGVYLVARLFPVYSMDAPNVLTFIAYLGAFTSLFAAVIACAQTDIKRVLAFSTISQIAYMMVALGVARYGADQLGFTASMWHLFTHAMFKALLFLCAGAIIHCIGSNEMGKMGGLHKYQPITHITFLIACLAISGIPPFSGFFSKDEILAAAFESNKLIWFCETFVAGLTAFYMFRLYYHIFWYEDPDYGEHKPHDAHWTMTVPLIVLAAYTCICGFFPFGHLVTASHTFIEIHTELLIAGISICTAILGIAIATILYRKKNSIPDAIIAKSKLFCNAAYHRFYIDECWYFITRRIIFGILCAFIAWFDRHIIDGFMNLLGWITNKSSLETREIQSGNVQEYVWVFIMGVITIAALALYL